MLDQYRLVEGEGEEGGGETENTPSDEGEARVRLTKRKAEELEWLECPVCMETPRSGPIFSCRKGGTRIIVLEPNDNNNDLLRSHYMSAVSAQDDSVSNLPRQVHRLPVPDSREAPDLHPEGHSDAVSEPSGRLCV